FDARQNQPDSSRRQDDFRRPAAGFHRHPVSLADRRKGISSRGARDFGHDRRRADHGTAPPEIHGGGRSVPSRIRAYRHGKGDSPELSALAAAGGGLSSPIWKFRRAAQPISR